MTTSTITAGGSASNLAIANGNDGTLVLQTGDVTKVNALSFAADGTPTFLKAPVNPVQSMVRVHTAAGYGSTATMIRRISTVLSTQGTDIDCNENAASPYYATRAADGTKFTIATSGVYAMTYCEQFGANDLFGISVDAPSLTTSIASVPQANRLAISMASGGLANYPMGLSYTGYLAAGAIVRPHTDGDASGTTPAWTSFTIVRVA